MTRGALVVDDDPVSRLVLCHMLRNRGWTVDQAADVPAAVAAVGTTVFDLVVSDFHLPSGNGIDVLDAVQGRDTTTVFVLVTGIIEFSTLPADTARRLGAQLTKPVSSEILGSTLGRLFPPTTG